MKEPIIISFGQSYGKGDFEEKAFSNIKYFMDGKEKNYVGDVQEFEPLLCDDAINFDLDAVHFDLDGYKEFESRLAYAFYHYMKKNLPRKKKKKLRNKLLKK